MSISQAAGIVGINYENAKAIIRVFKTSGRQTKVNKFPFNSEVLE